MKLTFALLEKYRDIINFTALNEYACPLKIYHSSLKIYHSCEDCEFYTPEEGCAIAIHAECNQALLSAFKQKYPELFI